MKILNKKALKNWAEINKELKKNKYFLEVPKKWYKLEDGEGEPYCLPATCIDDMAREKIAIVVPYLYKPSDTEVEPYWCEYTAIIL